MPASDTHYNSDEHTVTAGSILMRPSSNIPSKSVPSREKKWARHIQRGIAQPGSALVWGTSGRRFKSGYPDQFNGN